jgi:hypothetical protein
MAFVAWIAAPEIELATGAVHNGPRQPGWPLSLQLCYDAAIASPIPTISVSRRPSISMLIGTESVQTVRRAGSRLSDMYCRASCAPPRVRGAACCADECRADALPSGSAGLLLLATSPLSPWSCLPFVCESKVFCFAWSRFSLPWPSFDGCSAHRAHACVVAERFI